MLRVSVGVRVTLTPKDLRAMASHFQGSGCDGGGLTGTGANFPGRFGEHPGFFGFQIQNFLIFICVFFFVFDS